jgi:hypothetical protein
MLWVVVYTAMHKMLTGCMLPLSVSIGLAQQYGASRSTHIDMNQSPAKSQTRCWAVAQRFHSQPGQSLH